MDAFFKNVLLWEVKRDQFPYAAGRKPFSWNVEHQGLYGAWLWIEKKQLYAVSR